MGYTTSFVGKLEFTKDITGKQLALLNKYLGKDIRDLTEGDEPDLDPQHPMVESMLDGGFYHIQFQLTEDFSGIEWDGTEKFYGAVEIVNFLTVLMRDEWPEFKFKGELIAQGEDPLDRWILRIREDGVATEIGLQPSGTVVECPSCGEKFELQTEED